MSSSRTGLSAAAKPTIQIRNTKSLIESRVHLGSAMDERPLSEIDLPEGCLGRFRKPRSQGSRT